MAGPERLQEDKLLHAAVTGQGLYDLAAERDI